MWEKVIGKINYWIAGIVWKKGSADKVRAPLDINIKPFFDDKPQLKNAEINASYIHSNQQYEHLEYIKICEGTFFIDPYTGLLIDEKDRLLEDSIIIKHKALYPQYLRYKKAKATNLKKIPEAILFDYHKGSNYFHFYSDVLGKLHMIQNELPHLKNLPLLIGEEMYKRNFFQFFMQFPEVSGFNWYLHKKGEIVQADKTYLLQPMPYDMKYWYWIKDLCKDYIVPQQTGRKIFIDRPRTTGRHIENYEEIHELVKSYGYEIAEMENKTIGEQIALFSSASDIISIHGAAMINLLFCNKNVKVLEIMPNERISSHYYWTCKQLGLAYECILGGDLKKNRLLYPKGKFYLDPSNMKNYLDEWATQT